MKLSHDRGQKHVVLRLTEAEAKALADALFGYLATWAGLGRSRSVGVAGKIKDYVCKELKAC